MPKKSSTKIRKEKKRKEKLNKTQELSFFKPSNHELMSLITSLKSNTLRRCDFRCMCFNFIVSARKLSKRDFNLFCKSLSSNSSIEILDLGSISFNHFFKIIILLMMKLNLFVHVYKRILHFLYII